MATPGPRHVAHRATDNIIELQKFFDHVDKVFEQGGTGTAFIVNERGDLVVGGVVVTLLAGTSGEAVRIIGEWYAGAGLPKGNYVAVIDAVATRTGKRRRFTERFELKDALA